VLEKLTNDSILFDSKMRRISEVSKDEKEATYNVTCGKFEAKFKLLPTELVAHVARQLLESIEDNRNFSLDVVNVVADATSLVC